MNMPQRHKKQQSSLPPGYMMMLFTCLYALNCFLFPSNTNAGDNDTSQNSSHITTSKNTTSAIYSEFKKKITSIRFNMNEAVVYADFYAEVDSTALTRILQEGTQLSFIWRISIEEVRTYWLDRDLGAIEFIRQAKPDLVSGSLRLTDNSSDIRQQALSAEQAIRFLSSVDHFPIVDLSLLESGKSYHITAKLHINEGELGHEWWKEWTRFGKTVATGELTAP